MHIASSAGSLPPLSQTSHAARGREAGETPGPDHDGDGDDKGARAASSASAKSPTMPGLGTQIDLKA
jgi:hypothetical protein